MQALGKFAHICFAVHDLLRNPKLAHSGLAHLKAAFSRFAANKQQFPLYYESKAALQLVAVLTLSADNARRLGWDSVFGHIRDRKQWRGFRQYIL